MTKKPLSDSLIPIFTFIGVTFVICCACASVGLPPLWAGIIGGSLGAYIAKQ